ncbi:hypothetical protein HK097_009115 [Rhizophlyctis rosea]|uniref:GH16 domain-containing protein n=1 Tax=Rhizophlyctis rosea TaxID=64517 RepID=A0AAD5SJ65_9FUNG|nr:hypothetical protein HK097_009115 [Rhizophlyctis rosea]
MFKLASAILVLGALFGANAEIAQGTYDIAPFQNVPAAAGSATFIQGSNRVVGMNKGLTFNNSTGSLNLLLDLANIKYDMATPGTCAVPAMPYKAGEMACAKYYFPDNDYSGIVLAYYGLESNVNSAQDGRQDEQDFEWLGKVTYYQTNIFLNGGGGREKYHNSQGKNYELCLGNTGNAVQFYTNGQLIRQENIQLDAQYAWTSIWRTKGIWNCCGEETSTKFNMVLQEFGIFKLGGGPVATVTTTRTTTPATTTTRGPCICPTFTSQPCPGGGYVVPTCLDTVWPGTNDCQWAVPACPTQTLTTTTTPGTCPTTTVRGAPTTVTYTPPAVTVTVTGQQTTIRTTTTTTTTTRTTTTQQNEQGANLYGQCGGRGMYPDI